MTLCTVYVRVMSGLTQFFDFLSKESASDHSDDAKTLRQISMPQLLYG